MTTILYEAENFTKPGGTGIKTYVENLAQTARSVGYKTEALLSSARPLNKNDPLLAEVDFFEAKRRQSIMHTFVRVPIRYAIGAPFGVPTMALPRSGVVVRPDESRASDSKAFDSVRIAYWFAETARLHLKRYGQLARVNLDHRPDIFHASQAVPLRAAGALNIYTIHDIVPLRLPYATLDNKKMFLETVRAICKTADHIVTVSEHSRRDILSVADISEDRITNTYQTVRLPASIRAQSDDDVARFVENVFGLEPKSYFVFVGALEPKKNVSRLIDAFAASGAAGPLIIAGGLGWTFEEAVAKIEQEHFDSYRIATDRIVRERRVRRLEYLSLASLVALIRGAKALLFPSLYEGFGLPVLESMVLGAPVMTSTTSSLPEVAGDAALLVDPYDVAAMARAIRTLDSDADLRAELSRRGRLQAEKFSPEAYRARVETLYANLTGSRPAALKPPEVAASLA